MNMLDPNLIAKIQWLKRALDLDDEAFLISLESETDFKEQTEWMVQSIIELEAFSASVGDLIKEYDNKQNRIDGRVKWLRGRLKHLMQEAGQKTLKFPIGTAIVSTPKHGRVLLVSPDHVPEHYWRVKREPNLVLIEEALKNDQFVPGATLGKPEPRLTIRK